jgi:hypothetical protein
MRLLPKRSRPKTICPDLRFIRHKNVAHFPEMELITNSHQSQKSCRKYKSEKGANMDLWIC